MNKFYVVKRDGSHEDVFYDKIRERIEKMISLEPKLSDKLDPGLVVQKIVGSLTTGITTKKIDDYVAQTCAYLNTEHYDYGKLAGRISVSNLHKETPKKFSESVEACYKNIDVKSRLPHKMYSDEIYKIVMDNRSVLDDAILEERDFSFDYFGFRVLEESYLLKANGKIMERPQYLLMRTALGIHKDNLERVIEVYRYLSWGYFIHATPTLFSASTPFPQMSSCYLLSMFDDSIDGIYKTLRKCANISKYAGGIGLSVNNIRASGSTIRGTNGVAEGIHSMLPVYNSSARYVNQGGGKRKGSIAIYYEPWHADILNILELKRNRKKEEEEEKEEIKGTKTRDLHFGLWIPDLFMKRVIAGEKWSLFCPNDTPGLNDTWGDEFEELYLRYEKEGRARQSLSAQELWFKIIVTQIETGSPYILYKDACNRKSNQNNLGTIKCSNLCTEIIQYTDKNEIAVCNLASIALPKCIKNGKFDFKQLYDLSYILTLNLNNIIDNNYYPVKEARYSNLKHRPIGIGVQGLANVFLLLKLPWDSEGARKLNREIFETIYFAAVTASKDLAIKYGPYESFHGSTMSKGKFQFDLWKEEYEFKKTISIKTKNNEKVVFKDINLDEKLSGMWDWESLRKDVIKYGVRNSLLIALMPTASTSQILGNVECIEPYTSNIYTRKVQAGDFTVVNSELIDVLSELGIWSKELKDKIILANGSIQGIKEIPSDVKELFRTNWEIKMKTLVDMSIDRGLFIDQSQSFNCFFEKPEIDTISKMLIYSWTNGLKTGMYYLRIRPASDPVKFTIQNEKKKVETKDFCEKGCDSCGA